MIGTIERIKNSVLIKCSTLNENMISKTLEEIIDTRIYRFSEELMSLTIDINLWDSEEVLRSKISELIKTPIIKKIKRKLFIDSLALQITNDTFIEDYVNNNVSKEDINKNYINELNVNKSSNQLNMTENLNLDEIINPIRSYIDKEVVPKINENSVLVNSVYNLVINLQKSLEDDLKTMIENADNEYLNILNNELENKEGKEANNMKESNDTLVQVSDAYENSLNSTVDNKFNKYDDMTLFNKMILSLNTEEEKLSRKEAKLEEEKKEVDRRLTDTNKNIEANIERENKLSQRKLELNTKEVELNSRLSEVEVIFLNMRPLIKGLNKIKGSSTEGGNNNE